MANRFLSNIRINDAYTFPASDGSNGQVIVTDGSGNLAFANPATSSSASIIYRDNFTGDGSTVAFTLQNSLSDEDQTFIYIDGVYQEKGTYSLSTNTITFTTAPDTGHSIEVISVSGINVGPTTIYQDNFTGDGTTTNFTLAQVIDNEVKTMIYFNGVYQFKGTYSLNGTALSFDTAPANGVDIEVISIASAAAADYNQKVLFYGKANEAISKGDAIMLGGQEGDHFLLAKATQVAIAANHEYFLGLASQDLAQGEFGYVTEFGKITELDTSGYTAGDILWFDAGGSTAGALTTTEPAPPLAKIQVAAVIRSHQNEGVLFIRPSWYHELGELHDVNVTSVADKDMLVWDNANGYWENTKALGDITTTSLAVDTDTLYVDSVNNRVGIGTNSPDYGLHVSTGNTALRLDNNGAEELSILPGFSTFGIYFQSYNRSAGTYEKETHRATEYVWNGSGGQELVRINTSGNLGVGTTSPSKKLHIKSSGNEGIFMEGTGGSGHWFDFQSTGVSNLWSMGAQSGLMGWYNRTDSSYKMVITDAGRVGIGTTSPSSNLKLQVDGAIGTQNGRLFIGGESGSGNDAVEIYKTGNTLRAYINNGAYGGTFGAASLNIDLWDGSSYETRISGYGDSFFKGSVGIGTNSPSEKLEVNSGTANIGLALTSTDANSFISFKDSTTATHGRVVIGAMGEDLGFFTSGVVRGYFKSNGTLQLNYGNASALNAGEGVITDPGTFTGMKLYGSSDGNLKIFNVRNNSSFGNILFYTGASVERFRIDNYGTLQVTESSANGYINGNGTDLEIDVNRHPETGAFSDATKGHARIALRAEDSGAGSRIIFSTASAANTPGTERMRIKSNGYVGINTTNPIDVLSVGGGITSTGLSSPSNTSVGSVQLGYDTGTSAARLRTWNSSPLFIETYGNILFYTNGVQRVSIDTAGVLNTSQKINISNYTSVGQTSSGAMSVFGHNVHVDTSTANTIKASNTGYYAQWIKMYYNQGITFHTVNNTVTAGDTLLSGTAANSAERMRIQNDGEVVFQNSIQLRNGQINSLNSSGGGQSMYLNFQGNGAVYAGSSYAVLYSGSDERIKKEIAPVENTLDKVLALAPKRFKYKESLTDTLYYGFIAQDVEQVFPDLVKEHEGTTICEGEEIQNQKSIESYGLVWASILTKALQEQQTIIEDLKARIQTLENN